MNQQKVMGYHFAEISDGDMYGQTFEMTARVRLWSIATHKFTGKFSL